MRHDYNSGMTTVTSSTWNLTQEFLTEHLNENVTPFLTSEDIEEGRTSLLRFAEIIHPEWKMNWHHRVMCEAIENVIRGVACAEMAQIEQQHGKDSVRANAYRTEHFDLIEPFTPLHDLVITIAPGSAKSEYGSCLGPAWALGKMPHWSVILACYNQDRAKVDGEKTRNLLQDDPNYREMFKGVEVDGSHASAVDWKIQGSNERSSMLSVGVGGSATGFRARLIIVDDPIKNPSEASSEAVMESHFQWFTGVAQKRLYPSVGAKIIIMTRWAEDDLVGRLLEIEDDSWRVVHVPAIPTEDVVYEFRDGTTYERKAGEPLWADGGMTLEFFEKERKSNPLAFEAQYQGNPIPAGGVELDPAYLQECTEEEWEECHNWVMVYGIDLSTGAGKDYTAIAKLRCNFDTGKAVLVDIVRGKWGFAELLAKVRWESLKDNPLRIIIESNAFQAMIAQHLKDITGLPIIKSNTRIGKSATHNAVYGTASHFLARRVTIPPLGKKPYGIVQFESEWASFPKGKNDDTLDAVAKAIEGARFTPIIPNRTHTSPFNRGRNSKRNQGDHPLLKFATRSGRQG